MAGGDPDDPSGPAPRRKKRRRTSEASSPRAPAPPAPPDVAASWLPGWAGWGATAAGIAFLGLVFSDAVSTGAPVLFVKALGRGAAGLVPGPLRYFGQIAKLFPSANRGIVEYHAEGWSCRDKRWKEIDVRPWFPIDADEKESRFARAVYFFKRERGPMQALDEYIVSHANRDALDGAARGAGGDPIGGARFSILLVPIPAVGEKVERYAWHTIAASPASWKKDYYRTLWLKRRERCTAMDAAYDDHDLEDVRKAENDAEKGPKKRPEAAEEEAP